MPMGRSSLLKTKSVRLYLALVAVALAALVGGVSLAVFDHRDPDAEQSAEARLAAARSARSALGRDINAAPEPSPVAEPAPIAAAVPGPVPGFEVGCKDAGSIPAQSADVFDCKVTSKAGFSGPVLLKCVNPPKGLSCEPNPASVTPPPGGSIEFHLSLSNQSVSSGKHSFKVTGTSGALTHSFNFPFNFTTGGGGGGNNSANTVSPTCPMFPNNTVTRGQTITSSCQVVGIPSFTGTINVSCYVAPIGTCTVSPTSVNLSKGVPVPVLFTLTVSPDAPLGFALAGIGATDPLDRFQPGGGGVPVSVVASKDYSSTCQPNAAVPVNGKTQLTCEIRTGNYTGNLEIGFGAMAESGSPAASATPSSVQMGPNSQTTVTLSFDASGVAPGSFQYFFLLKQPGVLFDGTFMPTFHYPTIQVYEPSPPPPPPPPAEEPASGPSGGETPVD